MNFLPENGNTVSLIATIQPASEGDIIEFELIDVSTEPGVALNFGTQTGPDLVLQQDDQIDPTVQVTSLITAVATGPAAGAAGMAWSAHLVIRSLDFGARGEFQTSACFLNPGGPMVVGVKIPRDDNENGIADGWAHNDGAATDDDDDDPPGNGIDGDLLSRYEEYRGFFVGGIHTRTSPLQKDVFIRDVDGIGPGDFTTANLGARVHYINADEWDADRGINFNSGFAHIGDQVAIKIEDGGRGPYPFVWGETLFSRGETARIPNNVGDQKGIKIEGGGGGSGGSPRIPEFVINRIHTQTIGGCAGELRDAVDRSADTFEILCGELTFPRECAQIWLLRGHFALFDFETGEFVACDLRSPSTEAVNYSYQIGISSFEVERGVLGTTPIAHPAGTAISAFVDPRDVIDRTIAHHAAQALNIPQRLSPSGLLCREDRTIDLTIMDVPVCAGSTPGNGYGHNFSERDLRHLQLRLRTGREGDTTGSPSGGVHMAALSLPPSFGSADQGPLALQLALEQRVYAEGETVTAVLTWRNVSDAIVESFLPPTVFTRSLTFAVMPVDSSTEAPPPAGWSGPGDDGPPVTLLPGEEQQAAYDVSRLYFLLPPGEYGVQAFYNDGKVQAESAWVALTIEPPDDLDAEALVSYTLAARGSERQVVIVRARSVLDQIARRPQQGANEDVRAPNSPFTKLARFLLLENYRGLRQWDQVIEQANRLLEDEPLSEFEEREVRFRLAVAEDALDCPGDCSGDRVVTINELIICVNIALGNLEPTSCPACDGNNDGVVAINDLIAAVNNLLNGCPA